MNPILQYRGETKQGDANIGSGRYYARYSQAETGVEPPRGNSPASSWILEAFDAQWFDNNQPPQSPEPQPLFDYYQRAALFVLEILYLPQFLSALGSLACINRIARQDEDLATWFTIEAGPVVAPGAQGERPTMTVYNNLFTAGITVALQQVAAVSTETGTKLDRVVSTNAFADATERQVDDALQGPSGATIEWSVVYDVGQGASNGFCESPGAVLGYLDFGGGVMRNTFTFPTALRNFCFTKNPPIVLSHWDWDHWSSASRDQTSLKTTWIAPRQAVGPIHLALMTNIANQGSLLLLPARFPAKWRGQFHLERCNGSGRNHSGIALTLSEKHNGKGALMLFPGDARYSAIPSFGKNKYLSVVAPHHGADMRNRVVPNCPGGALPRLVYSFGRKNTYKHPRRVTRRNHAAAGWIDPLLRPGTKPFHVRQTADRNHTTGLGHVWLGWQIPAACPVLPCTNRCQLGAQQL